VKAEYTTVEVKGEGEAFEEALAAEQSRLQGETLWYQLVEGGSMVRYIRLRPSASIEKI